MVRAAPKHPLARSSSLCVSEGMKLSGASMLDNTFFALALIT